MLQVGASAVWEESREIYVYFVCTATHDLTLFLLFCGPFGGSNIVIYFYGIKRIVLLQYNSCGVSKDVLSNMLRVK